MTHQQWSFILSQISLINDIFQHLRFFQKDPFLPIPSFLLYMRMWEYTVVMSRKGIEQLGSLFREQHMAFFFFCLLSCCSGYECQKLGEGHTKGDGRTMNINSTSVVLTKMSTHLLLQATKYHLQQTLSELMAWFYLPLIFLSTGDQEQKPTYICF